MKFRFPYIEVSIIVGALFCHSSTIAFSQDYEKLHQISTENIVPFARWDGEEISKHSNTIVSREFVSHVCTQNKSPIERQAGTRRVIRDFVLYNYAHLADDVISGEGMYIETLYYLLGIEEQEKWH